MRSSTCTATPRRQFDSLAEPGERRPGRRDARADAPRDHRPRPDRRRAARPATRRRPDLTIIVGEEIRTADGDLIALFLERPSRPGCRRARRSPRSAAQGGLVGIPHPFDRFRGSLLRTRGWQALAPLVDWVEAHNARRRRRIGNEQAAAFALEQGLPGVAVSDAHTVLEVGVAYTVARRGPVDRRRAAGALPTVELVPGRAIVYRPAAARRSRSSSIALRGNGRVRPTAGPERHGTVDRWRDAPTSPTSTTRGPADRPDRPRRRPLAPRAPPTPRASADRDRSSACRSAAGCASRARSSRSSLPIVLLVAVRRALPGSSSTSSRARSLQREPAAAARRVRRSSTSGFPLRGCAGRCSCAGRGFRIEGPRLDRDHLHLVAGQLPRSGQARRRLSGVPAQDQQPGRR